MEDLGGLIEQDQGLAVKVLSMANSAYYGLQSQVSSVKRAVLVLGMKEIWKLFLLMSIRSMENKLQPDSFDIHGHWKHQVDVAHVAQALAGHTVNVDHEELFTAGLLHDLGKMLTAMYQPKHWRAIEQLAQEKGIWQHQAEDAYWGLDHALIGAMTLKTWFLPASLTEPVNWHHNPDLAQEFTPQARLLRLADTLVHMHLETSTAPEHVAWEQDLAELGLDTKKPVEVSQEVLQSDKPSSFLQSLGLGAPGKHSPRP